MSNSVRKEKKQYIFGIILIVIVAVITAVVVWVLSFSKETVVKTERDSSEHGSLLCKGKSDEYSFFKDSPSKVTQEVKILFVDNKMDKISLAYTGIYDSEYNAQLYGTQFRVDFEKKVLDYGKETTSFSPIFAIENNVLTISLYTDVKNIDSSTSKFFNIDTSEFNSIKSMSQSEVKSLYEKKSFSCIIQE